MKENLKNTTGITLVALVITIIILLILATVTIRIVLSEGIIIRAQNGISKYQEAEEKEKIVIAYSDYKLAKANGKGEELTVETAEVEGDEETEWTITFENGHQYMLAGDGQTVEYIGTVEKTEADKLIEKYVLGKKILDIVDMDNGSFKDDPNSITDASTSVTWINVATDETSAIEGAVIHYYIRYNNVVYRINVDMVNLDNKTLKKVYTPKGREGQKVTYNGTQYTILYDYENTVQMITNEAMGEIALGKEDIQATGKNDFEKAVNSYNNAITRLNNYCETLIPTDSNITSVRSVGSNPKNKDSENKTLYTSTKLNAKTDKIGKSKDDNYEQDYIRMSYWGVSTCNKSYWLASRIINSNYNSYAVLFDMRRINSGTLANPDNYLWEVYGENILAGSTSLAVRPVVTIKTSALDS